MSENYYHTRLSPQGLERVNARLAERFGPRKTYIIADALQIPHSTMRRILGLDSQINTVSYDSIEKLFRVLDLGAVLPEDVESPSNRDGVSGMENPFVYPNPLSPEKFWGRASEVRQLEAAHRLRSSRQILGPSKVGKTSLLNYSYDKAPGWKCTPMLLSGADVRLHSVAGFCQRIATELDGDVCTDVASLTTLLEAQKAKAPIVYIDDFELFHTGIYRSIAEDESEKNKDNFWLTLAYYTDVSLLPLIITLPRSVKELFTDYSPTDPSYFVHRFADFTMKNFEKSEAERFITHAYGQPALLRRAKGELVERAGRHDYHPMALQILCFWAVEARESRQGDPSGALDEADKVIRSLLPSSS